VRENFCALGLILSGKSAKQCDIGDAGGKLENETSSDNTRRQRIHLD
jgi:hypothetical protein